MSDTNEDPRDLEDEIFGGDSDLSDVEAGGHQAQESEEEEERVAIPQRGGSQEVELGFQSRENSVGLPKFKKDSKNNRASNEDSYEPSQQKRKKHSKTRDYDQNADETPAIDGAEEEAPLIDPEEQRKIELYARIDAAAGKNSTKRRRRKGGDDDLEMMADDEVARLRSRMMAAVSLDNESNEERRPATAKMMLLPIVTATMQKSHLETALLDNGILEAVKKWLEPLPDRSLPALNIQRSLLQLLSKMSIDTQSLKSSELGKVVLFYTKCPRIDPGIKRMADALVTTWLRPIIRRSASYRTRAPIPIASSTNMGSYFQNGANPAPRPQPSLGGGSSQRTRVPETIHQAFQFAPPSQLNTNDNEGGGGGSFNPAARKNSQKATAKKTREWARKVQDAKKGNRAG